MSNEKSKSENIFILICAIITGILIYYNYQEPQLKTEDLYIRDTISTSNQITGSQTTNKTTKKPDLNVGKNRPRSVGKESTAIKPTDSKGTKSIQMMSNDAVIYHKGFTSGDYRQDIVQKAYKLGGMDLILLMECESGMNPLAEGDNGDAYGLCQMNKRFHDIPDGYYFDREVQIEYCYDKMKKGTPFYGPSRLKKGQKCYEYVKDRFEFITK